MFEKTMIKAVWMIPLITIVYLKESRPQDLDYYPYQAYHS